MKFLLLLILQLLFGAGTAKGAELSSFVWEPGIEELRIQGQLSWSAARCDFTQSDYEVRQFPVLSSKGISGKPRMDPTGSYCFEIQLPPEMRGQMLHFSQIRLSCASISSAFGIRIAAPARRGWNFFMKRPRNGFRWRCDFTAMKRQPVDSGDFCMFGIKGRAPARN
jgi:hypothetical protein